ncbi:uncharacterized protein BDZ99DRAFT_514016 [Mytilinidion resinicola]|uniref:BTB domain-containing protein n=1 Tax=Mytilinidion resinicola TaxID=574789 RepID=A0A6A6Z9K1_9PEZI|nr:uncharacterized protein BDZ99DRAFT_514016 [Mytilinidion resinicola]KAF2817802.1 hypothetical protein BDZ99DRAFT_514016 [Mytilinidion resinicola]
MSSQKREGSPLEMQRGAKRQQREIDRDVEDSTVSKGAKRELESDLLKDMLHTQHQHRQEEIQAIKKSMALYYNKVDLSDVEIRLYDRSGEAVVSRYPAHRVMLHQSLVLRELLFAREENRYAKGMIRGPYIESTLHVSERALQDIRQFFEKRAHDPKAQTDQTENTISTWINLYANHMPQNNSEQILGVDPIRGVLVNKTVEDQMTVLSIRNIRKDDFEEVLRFLYSGTYEPKGPETPKEEGDTYGFHQYMNTAIAATKCQVRDLQSACSKHFTIAVKNAKKHGNEILQPGKEEEFHVALGAVIRLYYSQAPAASPHDTVGRAISELVLLDLEEFVKTKEFRELVTGFPDFKRHVKIVSNKHNLPFEMTSGKQPLVEKASEYRETPDIKSA